MHKNHRNTRDKPWKDQHRQSKNHVDPSGRRPWWANYQNRRRRREHNRLIHLEEWDAFSVLDEPKDTWMWS